LVAIKLNYRKQKSIVKIICMKIRLAANAGFSTQHHWPRATIPR
jgi:hypothetical protein